MKRRIKGSLGTLTALALLTLVTACGGGGGGGGGNSGSPRLFVSPEIDPPDYYDFGTVTTDNTVEAMRLTLRNDGSANLNVSSLALSDATNFNLGVGTCASASPTLQPGQSCVAEVSFQPSVTGSYASNLSISSNDPTRPEFTLGLRGILQEVQSLTVRISQLDVSCPLPGTATAYITVLDQAGFTVNGLTGAHFSIQEFPGGGSPAFIVDRVPRPNEQSSVAIVMDFSSSITHESVNVERMADAAVAFVRQMDDADRVEIIKFADVPQIQASGFTSDKQALENFIRQPVAQQEGTALYNAIDRAVQDTAAEAANRRKAIIVVSDGDNTRPIGSDDNAMRIASTTAAQNAGIPIFTVGLGEVVKEADLRFIADETGGTYSDAQTTVNLATVFQQLADLLFQGQYVLTYTAAAGSTSLEVTATHPTPTIPPASDERAYPCP